MMLNMDPPEHTKLRKIVNRGSRRSGSATSWTCCEQRADQHRRRDRRARASATSSSEVAAELPLQAIAELLGVPQEDRHKVFDWSNR